MVERRQEAYGFNLRGLGTCSRSKNFTGGRFSSASHRNDSLLVADCIDADVKKVLEYLVHILYPKRPTYCTLFLAGTIMDSYYEERKVAWGKVI